MPRHLAVWIDHHEAHLFTILPETGDHPTDRPLVAFARTAFKKLDRRAALAQGLAPP